MQQGKHQRNEGDCDPGQWRANSVMTEKSAGWLELDSLACAAARLRMLQKPSLNDGGWSVLFDDYCCTNCILVPASSSISPCARRTGSVPMGLPLSKGLLPPST